MANNKWIQGAIKHPGSFTAWCKRHGFKKANSECIKSAIATARKTGNKKLMKRAVLARTLRRMH